MPRKPKRLYDCRWERLSRQIRARDGYRCYFEGCEKPATTTDHIVPALEAPHLRLDPANCRASCYEHNCGRANARAALLLKADRTPATRRQW